MARNVLLSAGILLVAGCATIAPERTGTLSDMRKYREGLCAASDVAHTGFFPTPSTTAVICAQTGAPGTLNDDGKTPFVIVKLVGFDFETTNSSNYQLEVFKDGQPFFKGMFARSPASVPSVGPCTSSSCLKTGIGVLTMPEPWEPAVYTFRLTCAFNTSYVASTKLVFQAL